MTMISVRGLSKTFEYYKKELGFKNSIKNLFYREKLRVYPQLKFIMQKGDK
jgi:ABC-2 type transport system ATP-binding protein